MRKSLDNGRVLGYISTETYLLREDMISDRINSSFFSQLNVVSM